MGMMMGIVWLPGRPLGVCVMADGNGMYANLHAVARHRTHRTSDLSEDRYGGQPEER
jgi:hypothetical protein